MNSTTTVKRRKYFREYYIKNKDKFQKVTYGLSKFNKPAPKRRFNLETYLVQKKKEIHENDNSVILYFD